MRKLLSLIPLIASRFVMGGVAHAKPAELQGVVQAREPYGRSSLTWLFLKAYDVSLWTDAPTWSMDTTFALTIQYNMSFSSEEIVERTLSEMKKVAPTLTDRQLEQFAKPLAQLLPAVKSGDRLSAVHVPGRPVQFYLNGRGTGQMEAEGFAAPFFGIWLSPRSSEPSIREELLRLG
ncbi:MAG: chalcone isomerase family protein [Alphaproteobacteria bacterium]